jgi:HSP20 family protein
MNQLEKMNRNLFSDFIKDNSFADYIIKPLYGKYLPESINVDVSENASEYHLTAEIPGVNKEDIDVKVHGDTVTISTEIKQHKEEKKDERVVKSERFYGYVSRTIQLDAEVDPSKTEAGYKDGVLTLTLPKVSVSDGHRIAIN